MKITRTSLATGVTRTQELPITEGQLLAYEQGALVQHAFPELSADQREFFLTGMTSEEWDQYMLEPEDSHAPKDAG